MAESIGFSRGADRATVYREITPQIEALIDGETDAIANFANIAAVLKEAFGFFWIGFYVAKDGQLVLGPFQGAVACTRIDFDKGVCGSAFSKRQTEIVSNVDKFPGHIACSSAARSEIVVPVFGRRGEVIAVLDIDSDKLADFSSTDAEALERIASIITARL